jgi:integrase
MRKMRWPPSNRPPRKRRGLPPLPRDKRSSRSWRRKPQNTPQKRRRGGSRNTPRRTLPYLGEQLVIFPSTAGTLRDPSNFGRDWRMVRDSLGVPDVTSHSFRKSLATLIDDDGLSARIGADHLGHSKVSMTQDRYMARGRLHSEVAALLDCTISDE